MSSTACKSCVVYHARYANCDYRCSKKGSEKIYPKNFTGAEIKACLQNNIGIYISDSNLYKYVRIITKILGDKNTDL